jgi:hypothetical protein
MGATIQQRPTTTSENKLNKNEKKNNSSRLDWDIDTNYTKPKLNSKKKKKENHHQL